MKTLKMIDENGEYVEFARITDDSLFHVSYDKKRTAVNTFQELYENFKTGKQILIYMGNYKKFRVNVIDNNGIIVISNKKANKKQIKSK